MNNGHIHFHKHKSYHTIGIRKKDEWVKKVDTI